MSQTVIRDKEEIGRRIRLVREALGYSVLQVAMMFGYTRAAINYWEQGKVLPLIPLLEFCARMNITPQVLFEFDDEEFQEYIDLIELTSNVSMQQEF